jgi:hypothetical protein
VVPTITTITLSLCTWKFELLISPFDFGRKTRLPQLLAAEAAAATDAVDTGGSISCTVLKNSEFSQTLQVVFVLNQHT